MHKTLTLNEEQWGDVLHALRQTAFRNDQSAKDCHDLPAAAKIYQDQSTRLYELAQLIHNAE